MSSAETISQESLEGIKSLIDKYELSKNIYESSSGGYQEAETRSEFIDPFLRYLKWDVENESGVIFYDREVLREENQQAFGTSKKPDYTLRVSGKSRLFVEAKKPSIDITVNQSAIFQARSYGYTAGHPIVVLTNFRNISIYECTSLPSESDPPDVSLVFQCSYSEYILNIDTICRYLDKRSVNSDSWYEQFENYQLAAEFPVSRTLFQRIAGWKLLIAEDVISNNPSISESLLDVISQKLINRLLFVRVCEDRGIEGEQYLAKAIQSPTFNAYTLFNLLDTRYNSGLFDQSNTASEPSIHVTSNVVKQIVDQLYQPYSPFSFSILGADLLGIAYELALTERISVDSMGTTNIVKLIRRKEYYRRDVVTTPQSLVELTVADALQHIDNIAIDDFKVLDFAIGSGRFLLSAFKEIMKKVLVDGINSGDHSKIEKIGLDRYKLRYSVKCDLLVKCFYGIDIDYIATEIAKFSLLVTLLEDETPLSIKNVRPILPNLDLNIAHGNTLVRPSPSMKRNEIEDTKPLDLKSRGLPDKFDLIIGNPPYMKTEDIKNLNPFEYDYLKHNYTFAFKQFDKYMPFVEFSKNSLKVDGVCSVVIPNKWLTNVSGSAMREYFQTSLSVLRLTNYTHIKLFQAKDAYVASLTFGNQPSDSFQYAEPKSQSVSSLESVTFEKIFFSDLLKYNNDCWVLPKDAHERKVLDSLFNNSIRLKEVVSPKNGVQTSLNDVYVITKSEIISNTNSVITFTKDNRVFSVESSIAQPFLENSASVQSHSVVKSDSYIIYPYDLTYSLNGSPQYSIIDITDMKSNYPLTFNYLSAMKSQLSRRSMNNLVGQPFYAFGRSQNIASAPLAPKIFYSTNQLGDKYALDEHGIVFESGGTAGEVVLYPNGSGYSLDFVLALLDQTATEFYIRKSGSPFQGGYYSRGTAVIGEVPVPKIDFLDHEEKKLHDDISAKQKRCRDLSESFSRLHPNQVAQAKQEFNQLRNDIRDAFLARWNLTLSDLEALIEE